MCSAFVPDQTLWHVVVVTEALPPSLASNSYPAGIFPPWCHDDSHPCISGPLVAYIVVIHVARLPADTFRVCFTFGRQRTDRRDVTLLAVLFLACTPE